jgi:uncharacterized protein (DUF924 family)
MITADDVLDFWFVAHGPEDWWKKDESFDDRIRDRFLGTYRQAMACELWRWRESPGGRLAEIIVLDQFPRNMFREDPQSFAGDALALALSQEAVRAGALEALPIERKPFLILPYMHSESLAVHDEAIRLFDRPGLEYNLDFEQRHRDIILRFGRYPHRNEVLGRKSTPEELDFLEEPGSRF